MEDFEKKSEQLLALIEDNYARASKARNLIDKLKSSSTGKTTSSTKIESSKTISDDSVDVATSEDDFEDEVSFYLDDYKSLSGDFSIDDLIDVLPSRQSYEFRRIVIRLQTESLKAIKELKDLIATEDLDEKDLLECKKFILDENKKIKMLSQILSMKEEDISSEAKKNRVILVPSFSGDEVINIRIIEDMKRIPFEYYPKFLELFNSIINGTFKGVKKFVNNTNIVGIYEVKDFKIRILFSKIAKDTYAVITAFVKKTDSNSIYKEGVTQKATAFNDIKKKIVSLLDNPEFIEENDKYVQELIDIMSPKTDGKQLKVGESND